MRSKRFSVSPSCNAPAPRLPGGARSAVLVASVAFLLLLSPFRLQAQHVWESAVSSTSRTLWGVAWGKGLFVAVGDGGTVLTSPDGAAWTSRVSGTSRWLLAASYGAGRFVVVGDHGVVLTSPNGIDWTVEAEPPPETPTRRLNAAIAVGEGYFGVGEPRAYAHRVAFNYPPVVEITPIGGSWLRGLALGHGLVVAVGRDGAFGYTFSGVGSVSSLPATQNAPYSSAGAASNVEAVVFARDRFLAVGQGGVVLRSPDGRSWNTGTAGTSSNLLGLAYFDRSWVAVGDGGVIRTSDDGIAWTGRASPVNRTLRAVAASPEVAVAVGDGGALIRSRSAPRPPSLIRQPEADSEDVGGTASFTVEAAGAAPLLYQWFRDGTAIGGATEPRLTLVRLRASDAGTYTVSVSNPHGSVTSQPASLAISPGGTPIVDPTFDASAALTGAPTALLALPGDRLLVAGGTPGRLVRLLPDGALDPAFRPVAVANVTRLRLDGEGRVYLGGGFAVVDGQPRAGLARVLSSGVLDSTFQPTPSDPTRPISDFVLQRSGAVVLADGTDRLTRLLPDGRLDPTFVRDADTRPPNEGKPRELLRVDLTPDDRIVAAGRWVIGSNPPTGFLARFAANGATDTTFRPTFSGYPDPAALAVLTDGDIMTATSGTVGGRLNEVARNLLRLSPDGVRRPFSFANWAYSSGYTSSVWSAVLIHPDGRSLIAGEFFTAISGYTRQGFARLLADGTLDVGFNPGRTPPQLPTSLALAEDGRIVVGGDFSSYNGVPRRWLVRLNAVEREGRRPPTLLAFEASAESIESGALLHLRAAARGSGGLTYEWYAGGGLEFASAQPIAVTSDPVLAYAPKNLGDRADVFIPFRVRVVNDRGTVESLPIQVHVRPASPIILTQPHRIPAVSGRSTTLSVASNLDQAQRWYRWQRNGVPVGHNTPGLTLDRVTTSHAGNYTVTVTNAAGVSTESAPILVTVDDFSRFINMSSRVTLDRDDDPAIAGFVLEGAVSRQVLIRGVGPSLAAFGVADPVADPRIVVFNSQNQPVADNDSWNTSFLTVADFDTVGAFRLSPGSRDAALRASLPPGSYTVVLRGPRGTGLIEVYEADQRSERLINLSVRTFVAASAPTIQGIAVRGAVPKRMLFRAVGPGLAPFGVSGVLADPRLRVVDEAGRPVAENDQWAAGPGTSALAAAFAQVGAFGLPPGSADAALLITLPPGNYTALVEGPSGSSGTALIEAYELPPP